MPNKTITFGANLIPNGDLSYDLGSTSARWNMYGDVEGTASENAVGNARVFYGTCSTSAATAIKEITCPKYDENLTIGDMLIVKFDITNSATAANLKLKFSGQADTDAKPIKRQYNSTGSNNLLAVGELNKDSISVFIYNGTNWILTNADYNTNDNTLGYQIRVNNGTYVASRALYRYKMLFQKDETTLIPIDGTNYTAATTVTNRATITQEPFLINGLYTYYNATATVNANAAISATYDMFQHPLDLRYTFNTGSTLTTNKDVYLVAQPSTDGIHATLRNPSATGTNASAQATGASAGPITQTLPNSDDGYIYIRLGHAYSTYQLALDIYHPVYWYKGGRLELYSGGSVRQVPTTGTYYNWRKLLVGTANSDDETTFTLSNDTIGNVYAVNTISIKPAEGILKAPAFIGQFTGTGDLVLKTTTADSPDIVWKYGNTANEQEQARIWMGTGGSTKWAPQYRCYKQDGTQLYNGTLVLGDGTGASGTWAITANAASQLNRLAIQNNTSVNNFISATNNGVFKYTWVNGANAGGDDDSPNPGILNKPKGTNAFGLFTFKTADNWNGQIFVSTNNLPGIYWRIGLITNGSLVANWTRLANGNANIYYGESTTAADTAIKDVTCLHYHTLNVGDILVVKFTNVNSANEPQLNVNSTGNKLIRASYSGGIVSLSSVTQIRNTCMFIYDGTYWIQMSTDCVKQMVTTSSESVWRSVMVSASNNASESFTPDQMFAKTYVAHNVKFQASTGTLRATKFKGTEFKLEYEHADKAYMTWNNTDQSIDFIFV